MRIEFSMHFCITDYIETQGEDLSTVIASALKP